MFKKGFPHPICTVSFSVIKTDNRCKSSKTCILKLFVFTWKSSSFKLTLISIIMGTYTLCQGLLHTRGRFNSSFEVLKDSKFWNSCGSYKDLMVSVINLQLRGWDLFSEKRDFVHITRNYPRPKPEVEFLWISQKLVSLCTLYSGCEKLNIINFGDTILADKIAYNIYCVIVLGEKQPIQYPAQTIVPISMSKEDLTKVANFHRFV